MLVAGGSPGQNGGMPRSKPADPALPRELLVMRHAKSDRDGSVRRDFDRPLSKRGRADAPRMGLWMKRHGLLPDLVLASPAARARETAGLVAAATGLREDSILWEETLYDAPLQSILVVLAGAPPGAGRVLLVAHNPGLEDLVLHLGGDTVAIPEDGKVMPTGAVARMAMPADWGRLPPGAGLLREVVRPRDLGDG